MKATWHSTPHRRPWAALSSPKRSAEPCCIREGDPLLKTLYLWERFCSAMQEVGRKVT